MHTRPMYLLLCLVTMLSMIGCISEEKTPSYAELNIIPSNVRVSGNCDDVRSLEIWITQIYSLLDGIQNVRDQFALFEKDKSSLNDMATFVGDLRMDFKRISPPDCMAQSYGFAVYALDLANEFLSDMSHKTSQDSQFIVYLFDLFLSDQVDVQATYEAKFKTDDNKKDPAKAES